MSALRVCIVYPADPLGVIPGGIDTFIRGIIRWAPSDVSFSVVGVTTDITSRPVGQWTECDLGRTKFSFFPVAYLKAPGTRGNVPLSVRFVAGLLRWRPNISADILEFHRIEPGLLFIFDPRPKNAFVHQNMEVLKNPDADILWRNLPGLFYWLEGRMLKRCGRIYAVRRSAVDAYIKKYPDVADRVGFIPTWFDPEIFSPAATEQREATRRRYGFKDAEKVIATVGRLDQQKDPLLLLRSFKLLCDSTEKVKLIFVGDGVLRSKVEDFVVQHSLNDRVMLFGLRSATEVADILSAVDLFALSSAYEGMPMCVLEALAVGIPVVTTDVGEVGLVVHSGLNGQIVPERNEFAFGQALSLGLRRSDEWFGSPCTDAVEIFTPERVLATVYDAYRQMAHEFSLGMASRR